MSVLVISYNRRDQPQVRAVVSLLKAAFRGIQEAVYWDGDFEPGEAWFEQMSRHIDAAPQLFVFWCCHSATSPQVAREFRYALESRKRVVPVLLDDTPLAAELAEIHGIDLRGAVSHAPQRQKVLKRELPAPQPAASRPPFARWLGSLAAVLVAGIGAVYFLTLRGVSSLPGGVPQSGLSPRVAAIAGVIAAAVLLAGATFTIVRRTAARRDTDDEAGVHDERVVRPTRISNRPSGATTKHALRPEVVDAFAPYLS